MAACVLLLDSTGGDVTKCVCTSACLAGDPELKHKRVPPIPIIPRVLKLSTHFPDSFVTTGGRNFVTTGGIIFVTTGGRLSLRCNYHTWSLPGYARNDIIMWSSTALNCFEIEIAYGT